MPARVSDDESGLELVEEGYERMGRRRSRSVGELCSIAEFFRSDMAAHDRVNASETVVKEVSNAGRGRITHDVEKARRVFASVKDHFTEHHGRSLGSVVREKISKLKDAGAGAGVGDVHTITDTTVV